MSPQTRLERYELHTEWPLVAVAILDVEGNHPGHRHAWRRALVGDDHRDHGRLQRVGEEDEVSQVATVAQIDELRAEIQSLAEYVRDNGGVTGNQTKGDR